MIANELHTRKRHVLFVERTGEVEAITLDPSSGGDQAEIEEQIVERLVRRHDQWIALGSSP